MSHNKESSFRRIGAGFCGTVWTPTIREDPQFGCVFKREDGGPGRSLLKDFKMHQQVLKALQQLIELKKRTFSPELSTSLNIQVPRSYGFIASESNQDWWSTNLSKFPTGYSPCNIIHSERIPAVCQGVREILIDKYCPESLVAEIKASDVNRDCLIRPYLGRCRLLEAQAKICRPSRFKAFSLRNFPLHLNQMEQLGIESADLVCYSEIMAETLAMMHWYGEMDANDVEFVLAPPRLGLSDYKLKGISNVLGDHVMWLLDFDCCNKISLDETGVNKAVLAFFRNDPFYPRPSSSQVLWKAFRDKYLQTSSTILQSRQFQSDDRCLRLPESFIEKIERDQPQKVVERFFSS